MPLARSKTGSQAVHRGRSDRSWAASWRCVHWVRVSALVGSRCTIIGSAVAGSSSAIVIGTRVGTVVLSLMLLLLNTSRVGGGWDN